MYMIFYWLKVKHMPNIQYKFSFLLLIFKPFLWYATKEYFDAILYFSMIKFSVFSVLYLVSARRGSDPCRIIPRLKDLNWPCSNCSFAQNTTGHGCSKLTTSLANVSLKFQTLISQICQYFCGKN